MAIRGRIFGSLTSTNTPPPARERQAMSHSWRGLAAAISLLISTYGQGALVPRFAYVANNQDDTVSIFAIRGSPLQALGYVYTSSERNPPPAVLTPSQPLF